MDDTHRGMQGERFCWCRCGGMRSVSCPAWSAQRPARPSCCVRAVLCAACIDALGLLGAVYACASALVAPLCALAEWEYRGRARTGIVLRWPHHARPKRAASCAGGLFFCLALVHAVLRLRALLPRAGSRILHMAAESCLCRTAAVCLDRLGQKNAPCSRCTDQRNRVGVMWPQLRNVHRRAAPNRVGVRRFFLGFS